MAHTHTDARLFQLTQNRFKASKLQLAELVFFFVCFAKMRIDTLEREPLQSVDRFDLL